jgi:hypothetical protein
LNDEEAGSRLKAGMTLKKHDGLGVRPEQTFPMRNAGNDRPLQT